MQSRPHRKNFCFEWKYKQCCEKCLHLVVCSWSALGSEKDGRLADACYDRLGHFHLLAYEHESEIAPGHSVSPGANPLQYPGHAFVPQFYAPSSP